MTRTRATRTSRRRWTALAVLLAGACSTDPPRPPAPAQDVPAPAKAEPGEVAIGEAVSTDPPPTPVERVEIVPGVSMEAANAQGHPTLTPWEFAILMIDNKDLQPDIRRKKAYARRKVIMNNPDSPTARALEDLREAHQAGEIDVPSKDNGVVFTLPGHKPTSGRPPAGTRRPPAGVDEASQGG